MNLKKDVYIAEKHKEMIVDFLSKKTGMEWYMFRHAGEITNSVKPYFMEMVKGFDEAKISFDSHEEYIDTCEYCIQRFGKKVRLTFSFTEEEFELMKETAQNNSFINMVDFIITVLYALAMQGKSYEISLKEFSYFFFNKDKQVQITIPFEIMEKLNRTSFKKNQQTYFRKAMFWQIYFGKTLPIRYEEEDYFRVTPQKTGWFKTLFQCSDIIKNYARNKNLGSTENVAILNTLNTYLDQTVGEEVEEAEKETVVKEAVYD